MLGMEESGDATLPLVNAEIAEIDTRDGSGIQPYSRLVVNQVDTKVSYKVLLITFLAGEPLPEVTFDNGLATVERNGEKHRLVFHDGQDGRTTIESISIR